MIKNSFIHIPGITKQTELNLWSNNIHSWDHFLENQEKLKLSDSKKKSILEHITHSKKALKTNNSQYFLNNLPSNEQWRLYKQFKDNCCFLDIETTGLSKHRDEVTLIGLYDGQESKILINGQNLDDFEKEISKYDLLVTFNGKCFDVPFLKSKFPKADLDKLHIDLRYTMRKIGYSGGLKRIEKEVGIKRDSSIKEIDGFEAVRLWYKYKKGDEQALVDLVEYNKADIVNLKTLMDITYDKLREQEFLSLIE